MKHEHDWHPLSREGEDDSQGAVALWACSGRTDKGACLAIAKTDEIRRERDKQAKADAEAAAEREQRHFRWETD